MSNVECRRSFRMTNCFAGVSSFGLRHSFVIRHSCFVIYFAHPVTFRFLANKALVVLRIAESQVIPTRAGPLRHDIGFTRRFFRVTNPIFRFRQRRFACPGWLVIIEWRRHNWQFVFVQGPMFPTFPNNRERFAPISLTREQPISEFVSDRAFSMAAFFQPRRDLLSRFSAR